MKKINLIVMIIIIVVIIVIIIIFNNEKSKKTNNVQLILKKSINEVNLNLNKIEEDSLENVEENNEEDTNYKVKQVIKKTNKTDSIKKEVVQNSNNNKDKKKIIKENIEEAKKSVEEEKDNITEETKSVEVPPVTEEIKREEELNISHSYTYSETLTTDENGNSMNQETCYKESIDIQFRKSGISSTGCFSTGKYKDNGEEIYYLDVRYK